MSTDHAAQARSYSAEAGGFTKRAERDAALAASEYVQAARCRRAGDWLTQHPELWRPWYTPAHDERRAASHVRLGDRFLRSSFHNTGLAAFYRELAGRYRAMAARRAARMAAS